MPIFVLYAKAELEGVKSLAFPFPTTTWMMDVKQAAGPEERSAVVLDPEDEVQLENAKEGSMANFVIKFPGDKKQSSLTFLKPEDKELEKKKVKLRALTSDDSDMVPIVAMECRGLEPVKWHPTGPYEATAESDVVFDQVRLDEGDDWNDYDEKGEASLLVGQDIKYEFRRV
jgi:hypothetical protein